MPRPDHARPALPALLGLLGLLALLLAPPLPAQDLTEDAAAPAAERAGAAEAAEGRLPAARTTRHALDLGDRELRFAATAGALTLADAGGRAEADIAYVAYLLDSDAPEGRPVTFVVNGGPGAASAYLHLGVLGPWRLPLGQDRIEPSQPIALVPNAETWLDFTDLVFVDPVGTGFSRLVAPNDRLRGRYLSVEGDADALAAFILDWSRAHGRLGSPRYFVGESYGGFRGPLVAERLQTEMGAALSGLVLVSPILDFGWWAQPAHAPLPHASLLPSLAAAGLERAGAFSVEALAAAEEYAAGAYVVDLLRGPQDAAAVERIVDRVSALTGLDREVVARAGGRIDAGTAVRELHRDEGRIASPYDALIASDDPAPDRRFGRAADPVLDGLTAPLTAAMLAHHRDTLRWLPDRRYQLLNRGVSRGWSWGSGRGQPEAVGPLARALALDPGFSVLVVHGRTDLVTPYFASTLILRQLRDFGPGERVRQATYRGGHMFYTDPGARRAFRADALRLYAAGAG